MINVEHIEDWRGKDVVDPDGVSLGKLQEVFYDKGTQTPILLATKSGLLSRKVKLIPIDGSRVGPDYVRVAHDKASVDASPDGAARPGARRAGARHDRRGVRPALLRAGDARERDRDRAAPGRGSRRPRARRRARRPGA